MLVLVGGFSTKAWPAPHLLRGHQLDRAASHGADLAVWLEGVVAHVDETARGQGEQWDR